MGVFDGQAVSAEITNPAFINKNQNDTMPNMLGFTRTLSGNSITDIQAAVNRLYLATGATDAGGTGTAYIAPSGTILAGNSYQTALSTLAQKFDPATGHHHTGAAGDGPLLVSSSVVNYPTFPQPIGASGNTGTTGSFANANHIHQGVFSIAISGGAQITGYPVLVAGAGMALTAVSAGTAGATGILISATGAAGVSSIAASGHSPAATGSVLIAGSGGTIVSQTGNNIYIYSPTGGGSGTGTGAKNYLSVYTASLSGGVANAGNGNFELGNTTGWSLFTTTLTGVIPTGSISLSASSLTFTVFTGGQIGGTYSANVATTTTWAAGQGIISNAFYIDKEDQGKVMSFVGYYLVSTGASLLNLSGTSSNTFAVYIYDVYNSAWIQPAGVYNFTQSNGVGRFTGTFQTTNNSNQYQIAILAVNAASTGSVSMIFDDIQLGPQQFPTGVPATDLGAVSWTPTGAFTTNTTYTGAWSRIGKFLKGKARLAFSGAPNSTSATLNLPFTIDTSSMPTLTNQSFGFGELTHSGTKYSVQLIYSSTTALAVVYQSATTGAQSALTQGAPVTIANGDSLELWFTDVPIQGWSSNVTMSQDTDTRVVACSVNTVTGQSIGTSLTKVQFNVVAFDTHSAFDAVTNYRYTAPVSGIYDVTGFICIAGSISAGTINVALYKNGSALYGVYLGSAGYSGGYDPGCPFAFLVQMNAGDYIEIWAATNPSNSLTTATPAATILNVKRLSGPAVVASSESVNARVTSSSGITFTAGGGAIIPPTVVFDTHGGYNPSTGNYTCPVSGKYRITAAFYFFITDTGGSQVYLYGYHNGSIDSVLDFHSGANTLTGDFVLKGSTVVSCLAGDTLSIYGAASIGGSSATTQASTSSNVVIFERIGN